MAWALPTMSGIGRFIYLLTNWREVSADLEEYRKQIKDREEWADRVLEQQRRLHQLAEVVTQAKIVAMQQETERSKRFFGDTLEAWIDACIVLAQTLHVQSPVERFIALQLLGEHSRLLVDRLLQKLAENPQRPGPELGDIGPPPLA